MIKNEIPQPLSQKITDLMEMRATLHDLKPLQQMELNEALDDAIRDEFPFVCDFELGRSPLNGEEIEHMDEAEQPEHIGALQAHVLPWFRKKIGDQPYVMYEGIVYMRDRKIQEEMWFQLWRDRSKKAAR